MKRSIKSLLAALVVSLSLAAPVVAGPLQDGMAVCSRGDCAMAAAFIRKAAEQGDADAQNNLAVMYSKGATAPPDPGQIPPYASSSRSARLQSAFYDRPACKLACENVGFWEMEKELTHRLINACRIGCDLGKDHCR
jgi:TPR repeat protein